MSEAAAEKRTGSVTVTLTEDGQVSYEIRGLAPVAAAGALQWALAMITASAVLGQLDVAALQAQMAARVVGVPGIPDARMLSRIGRG